MAKQLRDVYTALGTAGVCCTQTYKITIHALASMPLAPRLLEADKQHKKHQQQ
jgi:hypothetical protein